MHRIHRFLALIAALSLVLALTPSQTVRAATFSSTLDQIQSSRDDVHDLWTDTLPDTENEIEDFSDDVVAALEDATDELDALSIAPDAPNALTLRFAGWLLELEALNAIDALAGETYTIEQSAYEDARDAIVDALDAFEAELGPKTTIADGELCPLWMLGAPDAWGSAMTDGLEAVLDELSEIEDLAADATTEELAYDLIRRTAFAGRTADALLLSAWRVDEDLAGDYEDLVADIQDSLTTIEEDGRTAIGTSTALANDLGGLVVDLKDDLDTEIDWITSTDPDGSENDWRDAQEELADRAVELLEARWDQFDPTLTDGLIDRAEDATTLDAHLQVRRDAYNELALVRLLAWGLRVPMSAGQVSDLTDLFEDIEDGAQDVIDALADSAPSSLDDLQDETDDLLSAQSDGVSDLLRMSAVNRSIASKFTDLPSGDLRLPVEELAAYNVLRGTSETSFTPNRAVTRFEFVKLLARSACMHPGIYLDPAQSDLVMKSFADSGQTLALSEEARAYMALGVSKNILRGVPLSNGALALEPNRPVTRFEAAKILTNLYAVTDSTGGVLFADTPAGEVRTTVNAAVGAGFFQSPASSSARFRPNDPLTRAEAAKIIFYGLTNRGMGLTTARALIPFWPPIFSEL